MIIDNCKVRLRVQIEKSEMRFIRGCIDKSGALARSLIDAQTV